VTLPLAAPGLGAGLVLGYARALGEFGATIVLAGSIPGETQTLAVAVYALLDSREEGRALLFCGVAVAISLLALAAYELLLHRQRRRRDP
jgi:molybdate transport system permease protein